MPSASASSMTTRDFLIEYNGENWDACSAYLANDFPAVAWDKLGDGIDCGLRGPTSFATEPTWDGKDTWSSIQDSASNTYKCVFRGKQPISSPSYFPVVIANIATEHTTESSDR